MDKLKELDRDSSLQETLQKQYDVLQDQLGTLQGQYDALQKRLGELEDLVAMGFHPSVNEDGGVRTGKRTEKPRSYRFDGGVLKSLQERAKAEGLSEMEALHD